MPVQGTTHDENERELRYSVRAVVRNRGCAALALFEPV
jgi:hypothetical protein